MDIIGLLILNPIYKNKLSLQCLNEDVVIVSLVYEIRRLMLKYFDIDQNCDEVLKTKDFLLHF